MTCWERIGRTQNRSLQTMGRLALGVTCDGAMERQHRET